MRIALVSDAWAPQVNGVVRTLEATVANLRARGHEVAPVTPDLFRTIPCPSYPEIRLAIASGRQMSRRLAGFAPEVVHIATEGPLGWAARRWCLGQGQPFTTSFHTRFPDYVALRTGLSPRLFWPLIRRFHRPAARIMVATDRLARELYGQGLRQTHLWSRGVDLGQFSAAAPPLAELVALPRPLQLYVGRVAVEKNLGAFLSADVPGTKIVVGDGPARKMLMARFPAARFLGKLTGEALARAYASADVFVFPSRTDTFGLVTVEALASGLPIAAYPVQGPLDIVGRDGCGRNGAHVAMLDDDLAVAIRRALLMDREACAAEGRLYSWDACTTQFLNGLVYASFEPKIYSVAAKRRITDTLALATARV